jgi:hypothetical protein
LVHHFFDEKLPLGKLTRVVGGYTKTLKQGELAMMFEKGVLVEKGVEVILELRVISSTTDSPPHILFNGLIAFCPRLEKKYGGEKIPMSELFDDPPKMEGPSRTEFRQSPMSLEKRSYFGENTSLRIQWGEFAIWKEKKKLKGDRSFLRLDDVTGDTSDLFQPPRDLFAISDRR